MLANTSMCAITRLFDHVALKKYSQEGGYEMASLETERSKWQMDKAFLSDPVERIEAAGEVNMAMNYWLYPFVCQIDLLRAT